MKFLMVLSALLVLAQCKKVTLHVKGGVSDTAELQAPLRPIRCNRNCPAGSQSYMDAAGECACVAIDRPMCRKLCPTHKELFAPCQCIQVDYLAFMSASPCAGLGDAQTGMCRAYFPRYFYNAATNRCESFIYGGCGGNANNFASKAQCESKCL